jgi:flagellar FliL protein
MVPDETEDKVKKSAQSDAMIDTSEISRGAQKVELDLEDAPFLEEEEEVKPETPKPKADVSLEEPKEEKKPLQLGRKKLIIIGVAALLLLVAAALAVKFIFFKGKPSPPSPDKAEHATPKEQAPAPEAKAEPEKPEFQVHMDPFWVEQKSGDDVRFLIVRILLGTHEEAIAKEFQAKIMPARNAIFYYLKNKDVQFLTDEENAERLKKELLLVVNQYVTDGKFETLLFEEYVVK